MPLTALSAHLSPSDADQLYVVVVSFYEFLLFNSALPTHAYGLAWNMDRFYWILGNLTSLTRVFCKTTPSVLQIDSKELKRQPLC